ncbi:helix-turn-helix domain-containing protein [Actinomadura graeca]|uniref:Helix-turn-helix domain-containing protein n=1 Tax=Actinomadura graeca TaxID=2750812 RepID=A0ABX8QY13_9ACTN|nr:Scr1 family TA system antitoxin-like transcriptional regulator [Actinomadura graeca]QXJ23627.1 helix-turn-helix domain-containing protein [Actinomadura graeca]
MGEERLREIGGELRRLRRAAGLSGVGLAARAGVPQPTVSRVETGRRVSDPEVVARLFGALELDPAEVERLVSVVREAYAGTAARRVDAGVSFRPGAGVELARGAGVLRVFSASVMPRLLWTGEFAVAAGLGSEDEAAAWSSVLDDEGRRVIVVLTEGALRTWPGSGDSVAGQFARLLEVSAREDVRVGILPGLAGARVPLHGFVVCDQAAVHVETFTRELTLTDAGEVRDYLAIFEEFEQAAVFGDEARVLIERAGRDLRNALSSIH